MSDLVITSLRPELAGKAKEHRARCEAIGIALLFPRDGGARTPAEQLAKYGQGREHTPDGWKIVNRHLVVTDALPEDAPHCRRAAYDCYPLYKERLATMDPTHGWKPSEIEAQLRLWLEVVRIGSDELGLVAGARWPKLKDWPHFELPGWRSLPLESA